MIYHGNFFNIFVPFSVLSLLTLVNFPAESCPGASGNNGTCMSSEDCYRRGGTADGTCASGYGSCCVCKYFFNINLTNFKKNKNNTVYFLVIASCGSMTAENGTYFVNQGYPSRFDGTASCQLTVVKSHPDVCQFRYHGYLYQYHYTDNVFFDFIQISGLISINSKSQDLNRSITFATTINLLYPVEILYLLYAESIKAVIVSVFNIFFNSTMC